METRNKPTLHDFSTGESMVVKALLCDPGAGVCGVGVKEIGYGISPTGCRRVMVRGAYMLQFITEGSGVFCGKRFGRGSVLFSVPEEPEIRITAPGERYRCAWITFVGNCAQQLICDSGLSKEVLSANTVFSCEQAAEAADCLIAAAQASYGKRHGIELLAVLFHVLSLLDPVESDTVSYVEAARRYMRENSRLPIRISDVAKAVSLSQNYLCKLFVRECGHSVKRELTAIRLANACELLENTNLSIRDAAYAVGFTDEKHFSDVFRKTLGITPGKYRSLRRRSSDDISYT